MSVHDQAAAAVLSQAAMAADGALLGLGLGYLAVRSILKYSADSSALRKIEQAPYVSISDLRSLLASGDGDGDSVVNQSGGGKLVVLRGAVEAKIVVDGGGGDSKSIRPGVLVSQESSDVGVILQRTQTCIYNEWRGLFGWTADFRSLFVRRWKEQESLVLRTVPFILVEPERWPQSDYAIVDMGGSNHPLPLTTVYHHLQPIAASPYTFLQALFGNQYPVGVLDQEKILPLGKEITAVGICSIKDGAPVIKSCKDLPYFLSDLNKDQMVVDLNFRTKMLFWSGIVMGSFAIGLLSYAVVRNWNKWKAWRLQRQTREQNSASNDEASNEAGTDEESGNVPDGELCVVCLLRRRRSAFIPCGHLVCCQSCAFTVERDLAPKCPVCRQAIRGAVRIYDS